MPLVSPASTGTPIDFCGAAGEGAQKVSEPQIKHLGPKMLGAENFDKSYQEALRKAQAQVPRGTSVRAHLHILNQNHEADKNQGAAISYLRKKGFNAGGSSVFIHPKVNGDHIGMVGPIYNQPVKTVEAPVFGPARPGEPSVAPAVRQAAITGEYWADITVEGKMEKAFDPDELGKVDWKELNAEQSEAYTGR